MNAYESFLKGFKPAYFCDHDDHEYFDHLHKSNLPFVEVCPKQATLFFESEHLKNQFLTDLDGAEPYTYKYFIAVGKALGYPPVAVRFFADCTDNLELEKQGAVFEYAGRYFGGRIDDKEQIAEWLWANVPAPPSEIKVTYRDKIFFLHPEQSCYTD